MIQYIHGDVTKPQIGKGEHCIIAHVVNDQNKFGSGVAAFMAKRYPEVKKAYHEWANASYWHNDDYDLLSPFQLGNNQYVDTFYGDHSITICNMLAQRGLISNKNPHPLQPLALLGCLEGLDIFCREWQVCFDTKPVIHMPKIGSLRGGANWNQTLKIINMALSNHSVYIYEFDEKVTHV